MDKPTPLHIPGAPAPSPASDRAALALRVLDVAISHPSQAPIDAINDWLTIAKGIAAFLGDGADNADTGLTERSFSHVEPEWKSVKSMADAIGRALSIAEIFTDELHKENCRLHSLVKEGAA
ncbi:hypothetical protein [uncultured Thiodictyon sp.]|uniref:hypothetical protein n=1 Tax=uncultured Thiodictyon sp. TaxID=1846217 RepID=UPI0025F24D8D|nr:hypothetical protein [uncultured Thiodictyon sp.]